MKHTNLFFPVMILFKWSTAAFQCSVNFCFTATCFYYTHVCVHIHCVCVCIYTLFYLIFFFFLATLSSMWDLSPHRGLNLHPLQWKCGVLTNGLPEKSVYIFSIMIYIRILNIVLCALQQELVHPFHVL